MSQNPPTPEVLTSLRGELRQRRRILEPVARTQKSAQIAHLLSRYLPFRRARRIAVYWSLPEEVDTGPIIALAQSMDKDIFLPVINRKKWRSPNLLFHRYIPDETHMLENQFGIPEPAHRTGTCILGTELDLVVMPLVGFNDNCDRIGMGGGYYDRAFEKIGYRQTILVGLGFACQQANFTSHTHDVPMSSVVTEEEVLISSAKHRH
jgi:5-formyltetrahydrofolate cyclo-ligase